MINPGLMRYKITIQKLAAPIDERGGSGDEWEKYHECRAYANSLFGSEYYAARQAGLEEIVKLTVRYSRKLDGIGLPDNPVSDYRLIFRGKYYGIDHIDNLRFQNDTMIISAISREGEIDG